MTIQISTSKIARPQVRGLTAGMAVAVACIQRYMAAEASYVASLVAEVRRRGGETWIAHSPCHGARASQVQRRRLEDVDWSPDHTLCLLKCEGWRYYSQRVPARPAALAYLAGQDDNGFFAVRVPGTIQTVAAAIEWLAPAEAKKPGAVRQGNVYAVPYRGHRAVAQIGRHRLVPCTLDGQPSYRLVHEAQEGRAAHADVFLPGRGWTLVEQKRLETARGRTRD
jgi:hypothetical protein